MTRPVADGDTAALARRVETTVSDVDAIAERHTDYIEAEATAKGIRIKGQAWPMIAGMAAVVVAVFLTVLVLVNWASAPAAEAQPSRNDLLCVQLGAGTCGSD